MPVHSNTCSAFFTDATIDPAGHYSPCTALGGGAWHWPDQPVTLQWQRPELDRARQFSAQGHQLALCHRCWSEESLGHQSQRQHLQQRVGPGLDYTDPGYYQAGPHALNIKVSNVCNLRCRTCNGRDSVLYHKEGRHYEQILAQTNTAYTMDPYRKRWSDAQLEELWAWSSQVQHIELYGGEPLLDSQIPRFLTRLLAAGRGSDIDFKVSTNGTRLFDQTWQAIVTGFAHSTVMVSVDALDDQFYYMRHPARWSRVQRTIDQLLSIESQNPQVRLQPVMTVSALNVWAIPEVCSYFQARSGRDPYLILVQWPRYYCVNVLPDTVRSAVDSHLAGRWPAVSRLMWTEPGPRPDCDPGPWQEFQQWTRLKDQYRGESWIKTFDQIGEHVLKSGTWYE